MIAGKLERRFLAIHVDGQGPADAYKLPSRGVAQPGSAPGSGPGSRRFKSSRPDRREAGRTQGLSGFFHARARPPRVRRKAQPRTGRNRFHQRGRRHHRYLPRGDGASISVEGHRQRRAQPRRRELHHGVQPDEGVDQVDDRGLRVDRSVQHHEGALLRERKVRGLLGEARDERAQALLDGRSVVETWSTRTDRWNAWRSPSDVASSVTPMLPPS